MIVDTKHNIGNRVFLKTDYEQKERLVTRIQITQGNIMYDLSCGECDSWHYDFEISTERDLLKASIN